MIKRSRRIELANGNPPRVSALVFQPNTHLRPRQLQRKALRPFQDGDTRLREHMFHTTGFKIVEAFDAVEVRVVDLFFFCVNVDQSEGRAALDSPATGSSPSALFWFLWSEQLGNKTPCLRPLFYPPSSVRATESLGFMVGAVGIEIVSQSNKS